MKSVLHDAESGWLDAPSGPLFCWYHPPAGPERHHAVLLCDPLGADRMNLHLAYRALAVRLASVGFAALRFDPYGTADASGSPRDPGWLSGWWEDAGAAADFLLARSGAPRLAAFGARFGGTLAASLQSVDTLLLWGPYLDGHSFLRSEKAMARLFATNPAGRQPTRAARDDEEYMGFVYGASARDTIRSVRPIEREHASISRVRIVAWDEDSPESSLASRFETMGARVDFDRPDSFVSIHSIQKQAVPAPLLDDLSGWLEGVDAERGSANAQGGATLEKSAPRLMRSARVERGSPHQTATREEAVRFGGDEGLFGILTSPLEGSVSPPARTALLFVNGGNNHRVGINRNYTEWARELAAGGVATLRFDVRGLGDSPPGDAHDLNRLYRDETRADVVEAIDFVTARFGFETVTLCGLCAGAYQSFHTACLDERVEALVLLDLLRWDPADPVPGQATTWRHRLRGGARRLSRVLGLGSRSPLFANGLAEITSRGTRVLAVSSREDGGFDLLSEALGSDLARLEAGGLFSLECLDDTNHIFSPLWAQEWIARRLRTFVADAPIG